MTYDELRDRLGRDIPKFVDVLNALPTINFFVEPKSDSSVEPLAKIVTENNAINRVYLCSFFPHRLEKLRDLVGAGANLMLMLSRSPTLLLHEWRHLKNEAWRSGVGLSAVGIPNVLSTKGSVEKVQSWGLKVLVWTPNTKEQIKRAIKLGADGIISDNVQLLKQIILDLNPNSGSFNL